MASGDRPDTSREPSGLSGSPSSPSKKRPGTKGKAGSSKKMSQKEQSERFKETARKLEVDESGEAFKRAIETLLAKTGRKPD